MPVVAAGSAPIPVPRHGLVRLTPAGWAAVAAAHDGTGHAPACIAHWARHDLPLVVARQPAPPTAGRLALGLPAPTRWGRLRLPLQVPAQAVAGLGAFPPAASIVDLLPAPARPAWQRLCGELAALGVVARVYGSYGWQQLTGLDHVQARSDLDLLLEVAGAAQADAVAACLARPAPAAPRLDGELLFADGRAVAWREWAPWRAGHAAQLLVKHRHGVTLLADPVAFDAAAPCGTAA